MITYYVLISILILDDHDPLLYHQLILFAQKLLNFTVQKGEETLLLFLRESPGSHY